MAKPLTWFRMHTAMLNDPKVQMLPDSLFKTWVNVLCIAAENDGVLPKAEALAFQLRNSVEDTRKSLADLHAAGLIDKREDGKFAPHNWRERQYKSDESTDRVRKHRDMKRFSNGAAGVSETRSETETEKKIDPSSSNLQKAARARGTSKGLACALGKGKADEALAKRAEGLGLDLEELLGTLNRQNPRNRAAYFTKLCVTKLSEQLPGILEGVLRDALWGKQPAYANVCQALIARKA